MTQLSDSAAAMHSLYMQRATKSLDHPDRASLDEEVAVPQSKYATSKVHDGIVMIAVED